MAFGAGAMKWWVRVRIRGPEAAIWAWTEAHMSLDCDPPFGIVIEVVEPEYA